MADGSPNLNAAIAGQLGDAFAEMLVLARARTGSDRIAYAAAISAVVARLLDILDVQSGLSADDAGDAYMSGLADGLGLLLAAQPADHWPAFIDTFVDNTLTSAKGHASPAAPSTLN